MIQFRDLYLEGFCSISELHLNLSGNKTTVIRGSNGSGKSQIFTGLIWVIYGKNIKTTKNTKNKKVVNTVNTWKRYQTKSYKGTMGSIYFESKGQLHKITRCQNYKGDVNGAKGNDRLIYEIDAQMVDIKHKPDIQSLIEKNLGMSYSLFMNSVMFGQGLGRIIQEVGTDKKLLFEEIFELGYLSEAREVAKKHYNNIQKEVKELELKRSSLQREYDSHNNTYNHLKTQEENFENLKISRIGDLEKKKNLSAMGISEIRAKVDVGELKGIQKKILKIDTQLKEYRELIKVARNNTTTPLEKLINRVIELMQSSPKNALEVLINIRDSFGKIDLYNQKIQKLHNTLSQLKERETKIDQAKYKLNTYEIDVKRLDKQIEDVKNETLDINSNKYKEKAKIIKQKLKTLESSLKAEAKELEIYKWIIEDPLGNNGLKTFLFESSLDHLNEILETYTDTLGFNIQFTVDLNTVKKDFDTLINMDGIDVQYEELSGGQKQLINLAMAFAMNSVLTSAKGINIAFLDEVFESLDKENIDIVVGLIRKVYKEKTLFLITHQDSLPIANSRNLQVSRTKGLSQYK